VRVALGATRGQIAVQLLMESLLLSLGGGALGLMLAKSAGTCLGLVPAQVGSQGFRSMDKCRCSLRRSRSQPECYLDFTPAFRATDVTLHDALKEGTRTGESRGGLRLTSGLVVAQFALAFALLVGSGLMI